jgi:hypothetical protein
MGVLTILFVVVLIISLALNITFTAMTINKLREDKDFSNDGQAKLAFATINLVVNLLIVVLVILFTFSGKITGMIMASFAETLNKAEPGTSTFNLFKTLITRVDGARSELTETAKNAKLLDAARVGREAAARATQLGVSGEPAGFFFRN